MPAWINRLVTPLTIGLFLVSAVSGTLIFLHMGPGYFHGMHEWLSMVLLLPAALHVWRNWSSVVSYFRRHQLLLPLLASLVAGAAFAVPSFTGKGGRPGGPPQERLVGLLTHARLDVLAPVLGLSAEDLVSRLQADGATTAAADGTLATVANAGGKSDRELLFTLANGTRPAR